MPDEQKFGTWLDQVKPELRNGLEKFTSFSDVVVAYNDLQKQLKENIVLPRNATVQDFRKASGQVPKSAQAYETQFDYEFEKPLKDAAFERGFTQSEYNDWVKTQKEARERSDATFKKLQSDLQVSDEQLAAAKEKFQRDLERLPAELRSQLVADNQYFLTQVASSQKIGADKTDVHIGSGVGTPKQDGKSNATTREQDNEAFISFLAKQGKSE